MTSFYQVPQKGILFFIALGVMAGTTIACQPQSLTNQNEAASSPTVSVQPSPKQGIYRNDRLGFQFRYPQKNFVIDASTKVPPIEPSLIAAIEVWTQQHYDKIKSGAYEGGTEYPANVQIAVYQNPQKLQLQQWIQQSNRFASPKDFTETTVAGRSGVAFQSTGLYEHEHVAIQADQAQIILITLSKIGYGNQDATYRTAFDQIVRSFQLL